MDTLSIPAKYKTLSGFALKRIAMVSMLIDHFGSIIIDGVLAPYKTDGYTYFTADMPFFIRNSMYVKDICEALGSLAFPVFCFLIAEGFVHTKSRLRYGALTGIFALLSEYPYDLAHYGAVSFSLQNVMFTLCIAIFTLCGAAFAEKRAKTSERIALTAACILAGAGLAFLVRSEYVFLGVFAISALYLLRNTRFQLLGLAPLLVVSPWVLLSLIPLCLYSGERGHGSKYFFYVFYPAHFLVFAGIARLLAGRAI